MKEPETRTSRGHNFSIAERHLIIKEYLGRNLWNIIDVIVAIALLLSLFYNPKETKNNT